jgi:4-hydroxythreonine-4-phosphate dehydrogenase
MGFLGSHFSVVLGAGHTRLSKAPQDFLKSLDQSVLAALQLRQVLPKTKRRLPIAVLGIDPHCGEAGLIGTADETLQKRISLLARKGFPVVGPLVPDTAFQKANWKKYSVFLASNHDQGLIPFKLIHGFESGVHITLGIPILRTSVDHGTAKDLFGKNKAQSGSMKDAITTACKLSLANRKG